MGRVKKAKMANRDKSTVTQVEGPVRIQYLEFTVTNPDTEVSQTSLVRITNDKVEAVSEDIPGLLSKTRQELEAHFVQGEEVALQIDSRILYGIEFLRVFHPAANSRLKYDLTNPDSLKSNDQLNTAMINGKFS